MKPAHVPDHLVYEFDPYQDPVRSSDGQDTHIGLLSSAPDIFWTPANGGHWMATRHADIQAIMTTPALFSSVDANPRQGVEFKLSNPPLDMDAPDHMRHRLVLLPFLSPKAVRTNEEEARTVASSLIADLQGADGCDFVAAFAVPMPIRIFMRMMAMDYSRYEEFVEWVHDVTSSPDITKVIDSATAISAYLQSLIAERTERPGDDLLSSLLQAKVNGKPISPEIVLGMGNLLFTAGLDTVTAGMTFAMLHLARDTAMQRSLRGDPSLIPQAVEELMRRYSYTMAMRRVAEDTESFGVSFKRDDVIICSLVAASNDPRRFADPGTVDLDRPDKAHLTFNTGPHFCVGAHLARMEMRVFLEEWLSRMPDVTLPEYFVPKFRGGPVLGLDRLDLRW